MFAQLIILLVFIIFITLASLFITAYYLGNIIEDTDEVEGGIKLIRLLSTILIFFAVIGLIFFALSQWKQMDEYKFQLKILMVGCMIISLGLTITINVFLGIIKNKVPKSAWINGLYITTWCFVGLCVLFIIALIRGIINDVNTNTGKDIEKDTSNGEIRTVDPNSRINPGLSNITIPTAIDTNVDLPKETQRIINEVKEISDNIEKMNRIRDLSVNPSLMGLDENDPNFSSYILKIGKIFTSIAEDMPEDIGLLAKADEI